MRRALFSLALAFVVLAACTVKTTGAPCLTDDQCPTDQRCESGEDGGIASVFVDGGTCVLGVRTFASACQIALQQVGNTASRCYSGTAADWLAEANGTDLCARLASAHADGGGTLGYDATQFGKCEAQLAQVSCEAVVPASVQSGYQYPALANQSAIAELALNCTQTFVPRANAGGACETSLDCADGYCSIGEACPGTCLGYVSAGGLCSSGDVCARGSSCVKTSNSNTGVCTTFANEGQSCAGGIQCNSYLTCNKSSVCQQRVALGGACGGSNTDCQLALRCLNGTCAPRGVEGDACNPTHYDCATFYACAPATHVCSHWPATVQADCNANFLDTSREVIPCFGSWCNSGGKCQPYDAPGADCGAGFAGVLGSCGPEGACNQRDAGSSPSSPSYECEATVCGG